MVALMTLVIIVAIQFLGTQALTQLFEVLANSM
jgi:hypothetical protein